MIKVTIRGEDLIQALCDNSIPFEGDIETLGETERVRRVQLHFGDEIELTLANDDEDIYN